MLQIKNFKQYKKEYQKSVSNPEKFWEDLAKTFSWRKKWKKVLAYDFVNPSIKWFLGGKLNITENCLDRHLRKNGNKLALVWEPNNAREESVKLTYKQLAQKVNQFANILKKNGIKKGDKVCIYMGMTPELMISMLACARIGAVHSVVFAGFSSQALSDRLNNCNCKLILTADGTFRGEKVINLKNIVDESLQTAPSVKTVLVLQRTRQNVEMQKGRDKWLHEELVGVSKVCKAEVMDSEDELFILYTSGSTGKPKGIVHTIGGYMVYAAYTFLNVFQYKQKDIFWCTADAGWITGHSYLVYGPLLNSATTLMFEGIPTYPTPSRFWEIVDKYKVNIFYTSPTAVRALQSYGTKFVKKFKLNSLKTLGTVGEPINVEAWKWYKKNIGKNRCAIVDTWWQTETGGFMISPLAHITKEKPGSATLPLPGVQPVLLEGNLCFKFPWPGMLRGVYGDPRRFKETYFSSFPGFYFSSDAAKCDKDGYYRITGRVDDVLKVSGHLLGTGELEDAINKHPYIVESAVVAYPHAIKGEGIYAFVILQTGSTSTPELYSEVREVVAKNLGPIGKPDKVQVVNNLPKTRSGKIMRRLLRLIARGDTSDLGDISTLLDPSVVEEIIKNKI